MYYIIYIYIYLFTLYYITLYIYITLYVYYTILYVSMGLSENRVPPDLRATDFPNSLGGAPESPGSPARERMMQPPSSITAVIATS